VTDKSKDFPAVMVDRFGEATGYVGKPRIAAAE
jgi:phthalate 4,5-dioxygenase oxygenase subunit